MPSATTALMTVVMVRPVPARTLITTMVFCRTSAVLIRPFATKLNRNGSLPCDLENETCLEDANQGVPADIPPG